MTAVDTNVLIYARDRRDERKMGIAQELIASLDDGVLLWQVACEYLWASRKLSDQNHSVDAAFDDINKLREGWVTALPSWDVLDRAKSLKSHGLSHWDALIVAACIEAHVDTFFSEDFSERRVESLEIVNPFKEK
jgi:predicted nucleic acid-binding protein